MRKTLLIACLFCGLSLQARAAVPGSEYWQRGAALDAARSIDLEQAALVASDVTTLADAAFTLERLQDLETRPDWPLPAREAALHRFTRSLAALPRDAVAVEVMQHLLTYRARTLVPHEDHATAWVPLFNIRAAALGVENAWQREAAASLAALTLLDDPPALVELFAQATGEAQRRGFLDALEIAGTATVGAVQDEAIQRLAGQPGLSPLLAATTAITRDTAAMRELLVHGRGAGLAPAFERFSPVLADEELAGLFEFALREAPVENAALAMATWWPRLRHDNHARQVMLGLLGDAGLGSSVALTLSRSPDVPTIKALKDAAAGDGPAARQARRALDLSRMSSGAERL